MSCRRTCRSGEWRAGRIWRRWVMHLSWITSRGQHLLVCQELQDQSAGSSYLTGNVCFKSIQEKRFCLFLALHLRGSALSFALFSSQQHCTENKDPSATDSESLCSEWHTITLQFLQYILCTGCVFCLCRNPDDNRAQRIGIPECNALDLTFYSSSLDCQKMKTIPTKKTDWKLLFLFLRWN